MDTSYYQNTAQPVELSQVIGSKYKKKQIFNAIAMCTVRYLLSVDLSILNQFIN